MFEVCASERIPASAWPWGDYFPPTSLSIFFFNPPVSHFFLTPSLLVRVFSSAPLRIVFCTRTQPMWVTSPACLLPLITRRSARMIEGFLGPGHSRLFCSSCRLIEYVVFFYLPFSTFLSFIFAGTPYGVPATRLILRHSIPL